MSLAAPPPLAGALGAVQRRERLLRAHAAARHALWGSAAILAVLGAARLSGRIPLPLAGALATAVLCGTLYGLIQWWRQPAPTPLDAARTADRRAGLSGLLTTAVTLPDTIQPWEEALHVRIRARAHAAAAGLHPGTLLPLPAARVWARPAALLLVAAGLWWPAPLLPGRTASVPRAQAVDEPTSTPPASTPTADSGADVSSPVVNEPTPEPEPAASTATAPGTPAAVQGATSDAATAAGPPAPPGTAIPSARRTTAGRLREARQGVTPGTAVDSSTASAAPTRTTQDTPFGSRESGQFQNESVTPAENLASAPYDPSTAPGAPPMQQKSDPGTSALRAASGGRGLESEGADRCVQGCLTNNDMNRGASPSPSTAARKKPDGETQSGTSDSGGGAAGSSSGVGLGVGSLTPIRSSTTTDLGSAGVLGDRIQVLAAPDTTRAPTPATAGPTSSTGTWSAAPEPPSPSTDIPPDARATVRTYFDRTASDRTPPTRTAP